MFSSWIYEQMSPMPSVLCWTYCLDGTSLKQIVLLGPCLDSLLWTAVSIWKCLHRSGKGLFQFPVFDRPKHSDNAADGSVRWYNYGFMEVDIAKSSHIALLYVSRTLSQSRTILPPSHGVSSGLHIRHEACCQKLVNAQQKRTYHKRRLCVWATCWERSDPNNLPKDYGVP